MKTVLVVPKVQKIFEVFFTEVRKIRYYDIGMTQT
jgi:hypothetical protein